MCCFISSGGVRLSGFATSGGKFAPEGDAALSRKTFSNVASSTETLGVGTHYAQVGTLTASRIFTLSDSTKALGTPLAPIEFTVFDESGTATQTNSIVLTPESGTINGVSSALITVGEGNFVVYTDGTNWFSR